MSITWCSRSNSHNKEPDHRPPQVRTTSRLQIHARPLFLSKSFAKPTTRLERAMAEESVMRFHAVMDKLFHAPPISKSISTAAKSASLGAVQLPRGKKRPSATAALAVEHSAPLCRPWDRGDLLRRLATFKSMTWFAKPEAIHTVTANGEGGIGEKTSCPATATGAPVNSCSTPPLLLQLLRETCWWSASAGRLAGLPSPPLQSMPAPLHHCDSGCCRCCRLPQLVFSPMQISLPPIGKAALIFSLKLDNGHKLLCPWVDNACDKMLAQFPPSPPAVLVDNYKKRCSDLLQLLALPVISSSAIDYMRSPQLEHLLNGSTISDSGNMSEDASTSKYFGNEYELVSSALYYQGLTRPPRLCLMAQKLISLCGWKPRLLPYIVDRKDPEGQSPKDANVSDPVVYSGQNSSICVYASGRAQDVEADNDRMTSLAKYDPSSVVFDCRLCGASVGLWAFSMTPRPVEFIRLVGMSEVNGENNGVHRKDNVTNSDAGASGAYDWGKENNVEIRERSVDTATAVTTSLTGTPCNLRLTIAGGPPPAKQNFRPTISLPFIGRNLRARFSSDSDFNYHQSVKGLIRGNKDHHISFLAGKEFQLEDVGLEQGKVHDDGLCVSASNNLVLCMDSDISEQGESHRNDSNRNMSLGGATTIDQGVPEISTTDSIMETPLVNTPSLVENPGELESFPENAANVGTVVDLCSSQVVNSSIVSLGGHISVENGETSVNETSVPVAADSCHLQHHSEIEKICSGGDSQNGNKVAAAVQPFDNGNTSSSTGKDLKQLPLVEALKFDPIRQHRHFCPWIALSGNSASGWQQTVSALQRQKEFSYSLSDAPSSSLIEVDDPVACVKELFMSPSAKRMKLAHGTS
ncbi:hypothetical protein RJ639_008065 [Escallonia herrerae]|uniref:C3HC-type domain-containing protein n=1 Tax=Escallonia herrerae TaxID=1293975 RepID=A0AA88VUU6_9ASTE|nr:hypothetical protein RJ639_008065 [Escallonia herrerae]